MYCTAATHVRVPSTLADVVTGHAASALCSVLPCSGRRSGCLLLPGHLHARGPSFPRVSKLSLSGIPIEALC